MGLGTVASAGKSQVGLLTSVWREVARVVEVWGPVCEYGDILKILGAPMPLFEGLPECTVRKKPRGSEESKEEGMW